MPDSIVAQRSPYATELTAGEIHAWCSCGRSANQPYCDGTHKEFGMKPVVFTAEKTGTAYLCGCKRSGNAPYCDGTHNSLDDV